MLIRAPDKKDYREIPDIYNCYIENTTSTFEPDKLRIEDFSQRLDEISRNYPFVVAIENNGGLTWKRR